MHPKCLSHLQERPAPLVTLRSQHAAVCYSDATDQLKNISRIRWRVLCKQSLAAGRNHCCSVNQKRSRCCSPAQLRQLGCCCSAACSCLLQHAASTCKDVLEVAEGQQGPGTVVPAAVCLCLLACKSNNSHARLNQLQQPNKCDDKWRPDSSVLNQPEQSPLYVTCAGIDDP